MAFSASVGSIGFGHSSRYAVAALPRLTARSSRLGAQPPGPVDCSPTHPSSLGHLQVVRCQRPITLVEYLKYNAVMMARR